ncbi:MAG TPA: hypothetical protein PKY56_02650 [Candidatus Kapabacteria bacterium]|nr:hypothetical protein [Candidatus Kapabacteria bacterium]HPO62921.1 hypothetical protein [Candidatus Kapabacteria bacterium]
MKNAILLLILIIFNINLHCQDIEQVPFKLIKGIDTIEFNVNDYPQENFNLGFQWSGTGKMMKELKMNTKACHSFRANATYDSTNIINMVAQPINYSSYRPMANYN